jgi:mono/diheme cytochrome c family protein
MAEQLPLGSCPSRDGVRMLHRRPLCRIVEDSTMDGAKASMKRVARSLVVALIVGCLAPLRSYAGDEVRDARIQKGKLWYDKYCTPCHGAGGAPGSALFAATKKPIDLRTIAQRNGGRFPTERWWDFVFSSQPRGVHAGAWERIRNDQTEAVEVERDMTAHSVAANIEYYVESIQNKNK